MPELPEVETSRRYVKEFCAGSTITTAITLEQGGGPREGQFDEIVIGEEVTAESLKNTLEGRKIVDVKRRGKQMWFVLDKPPHPLFHFGMTGAFTVKGEKRHKFVKFKVDEEWPPRFAKLELRMSNGTCLALTDPRRLARVKLRVDPEDSPPISLLGPDPITHPLSLETFAAALEKPTAPIKAVLLAQDRVVSGVGNWVADEVCFQAHVHPGAACNTLAPDQVAALHTKLLSVCQEACEARADYTVFPQEWLFHHRWGKGKSSEGTPCVSSGHPIIFDVVGGRTTAIVPAVQQKGLQISAPKRSGGGVPSSRSVGSKSKRSSATKANVEAGVGGEAKLGARGRKQKRVVDQKEISNGEEPESTKQEVATTGKVVARKVVRARVKAKAAPVAKKRDGSSTKRKQSSSSTSNSPSGGVTKRTGRKKPNSTVKTDKLTPATAHTTEAAPVALETRKAKAVSGVSTVKRSGRGKNMKSEKEDRDVSPVVVPTKRTRGEGVANPGSSKEKRGRRPRAAVKLEETATAPLKDIPKGRAAKTVRPAGVRRSPRHSGS